MVIVTIIGYLICMGIAYYCGRLDESIKKSKKRKQAADRKYYRLTKTK